MLPDRFASGWLRAQRLERINSAIINKKKARFDNIRWRIMFSGLALDARTQQGGEAIHAMKTYAQPEGQDAHTIL